MMPDEELESRKQPAGDRACRNCRHEYHMGRCLDVEPWSDNLDFGERQCTCRRYEPADAESILQDEGKI